MGDGIEPEGDEVVKLSKQLAWVLRRGAIQCGVWIDRDHGWVAVQDLLTCRYFAHLGEEGLMAVVEASNEGKPRYELRKVLPEQGREIRALRREDPMSFVMSTTAHTKRSAAAWTSSGTASTAASARSGGSDASDGSSCSSSSSGAGHTEEGEVFPCSVLRVDNVHGATGTDRKGVHPKPVEPSTLPAAPRRANVEGSCHVNTTGHASDKRSARERKRAAPTASLLMAGAKTQAFDAEQRHVPGNKNTKNPPASHAQRRRSAASEARSQGHRSHCSRRQEECAVAVAQQGGPEKVAAPAIPGKACAGVAALRLEYVGLWEAQAPSEETMLELARNRLLHAGFAPEEVLQVCLDRSKKHCNVNVLLQSPCSNLGAVAVAAL